VSKTISSVHSSLRSLGRRLSRWLISKRIRLFFNQVNAMNEPVRPVIVSVTPQSKGISKCEPITIVSANLWHDWPLHRELNQRLETFAQLVDESGADILLLQEVARTSKLPVNEWLAERLAMFSIYTRSNGNQDAIGFEEGLAVFSRFPLGSPNLQQLSADNVPFVRRFALGAEVDTPFGNLMAVSVHLGFIGNRNVNQVGSLRDWVSDIAGKRPALIGGDFNVHENAPQITEIKRDWLDTFRHVNGDADGHTHELRSPWGHVFRRQRLDYIFMQPGAHRWGIVESRHLETNGRPHSDHKAVLTKVIPL
jgi:endonuclease/exonuclease/phosphatase family metal-dependent hydrolase